MWISAFELRSSVLALLSAEEHLTSPGGFKLSGSTRFQTEKGAEKKEAWVWFSEERVIEIKTYPSVHSSSSCERGLISNPDRLLNSCKLLRDYQCLVSVRQQLCGLSNRPSLLLKQFTTGWRDGGSVVRNTCCFCRGPGF